MPGPLFAMSTPPRAARSIGPQEDAEIRRLVARFYAAVRRDELLGPIFEAAIHDWDSHLVTMRNFWASAVYRTGDYSGNPLAVHRRFTTLGHHHYERWLSMWLGTVEREVAGSRREPFTRLAARMAETMSAKCIPQDGPNAALGE